MNHSARKLLGTLGAVAVFAICTGYALAAAGSLTFVAQHKEGVGGVAGLNGAIDVAVAPDGANVYAVSGSPGAVATFSRTPAGDLTYVEQDVDGVSGVDGIGGARGVAVSADGKNVYVAAHADGAVATFTRNPDGTLTFLEQDKDGVSGVDGLAGAWGVAVSNDGARLYAAGDADNAVVTFTRDPGTGALTFVELEKDGVGGVDGLAIATGVAVSPDDNHVYVAGCGDNAVGVFARDATGLAFVEQKRQGVDGVTGLTCARGVAVDGTGANVYVAAESGDDVATFSRNSTSGALTFVEQDVDGAGGVDGLNGARDVSTTPGDCGSVYVASTIDDAVAVFSRDPATGALTFVEQAKDAVGGVDGLDQAVGVTASPSGSSVYATGEADDAVVTFSRETSGTTCAGTPSDPTDPTDPTDPIPVNPGSGTAARTVTLTPSKKKVKKGKKVKLAGDLSAPQAVAACEAGQAVEIQRKTKRAKDFATVSRLTSSATGGFSAKLKVKKTAQFRAVVAATTACSAAESPASKVKAKRKRKPKP